MTLIFMCHIIGPAGGVEDERLQLMAEFGSCSLQKNEITVYFSLPNPFVYRKDGRDDEIKRIYEIRLECTHYGQVSLQYDS